MTDLQPYQQRVVTERDELKSKTKALTTFIAFSTLPKRERELLQQQEVIMRNYITVLDQRIALFTGN